LGTIRADIEILLARRRALAIQLRSIAQQVERGDFPEAQDMGLLLVGPGVRGWTYSTDSTLDAIMKAMANRYVAPPRKPEREPEPPKAPGATKLKVGGAPARAVMPAKPPWEE
jgi:hypothetical protein